MFSRLLIPPKNKSFFSPLFLRDYPQAKAHLVYGETREEHRDGISSLPYEWSLRNLPQLLK